MINKGLSAILLSILIVCFFSFTEVSADENKPVISLNNASVIQGNSVTLTLSISTTIPYSALEIYILYDTTHFKADSVTHLSLFNDVNHQKDAQIDSDHQVKYIFVSTSNVTLSGNLLNIRFTTLNDANIDTFVVNVAINGMYDENSNSIEANTSNGSITITEKIVPIKSVSFNRSINKTQLQIEDLIVFTISSSNLQSMAASNFEMIFDHNHFEFIKVDYGSALKTLDVLIDINTNTRGLVLIAFANIDGLSQANPLMTFTFKVKADIDI
jgi:hypothetical protein